MAGGGARPGRVHLGPCPCARVWGVSGDDDCELWGVAGADGLSEAYGIGAAAGVAAGHQPSIITGADDRLPSGIESVKDLEFSDPPGGSRKDNGKRIVSGKRKDSERAELGRESFTEILGFAGSVTRAWCDFKNIPEFLAVQFSSGKRYCRRLAGHGSFPED